MSKIEIDYGVSASIPTDTPYQQIKPLLNYKIELDLKEGDDPLKIAEEYTNYIKALATKKILEDLGIYKGIDKLNNFMMGDTKWFKQDGKWKYVRVENGKS